MMQKPATHLLDDASLLSQHKIYQSLLKINADARKGKVPEAQVQFDKEFSTNTTRWQSIVTECELELKKRGLIFNELKVKS